MPLPTLKKGDYVNVYRDPITCQQLEGKAVVTSVKRCENWKDNNGRPIHRCKVRFVDDAHEAHAHERDVSEKAKALL